MNESEANQAHAAILRTFEHPPTTAHHVHRGPGVTAKLSQHQGETLFEVTGELMSIMVGRTKPDPDPAEPAPVVEAEAPTEPAPSQPADES
jgi:hypothetical protein